MNLELGCAQFPQNHHHPQTGTPHHALPDGRKEK